MLYFPFDVQICKIVFVVWTNTPDEVQISKGGKGMDLDKFETNGEWDVVGTSGKDTMSARIGSIGTFTVTIKRKPQDIMVTVVLPVFLMSILSVCTFLLSIDSGEKVSYSSTLYLAFAVYLTIVSSSLPGVRQCPYWRCIRV
ncbi:Neuronal acetylcholine receptor subunit alpha-9-I [Mizuhopecten yessoensis]|uniref:Neuronal acetylcholine receptor subunit alpha-9-I n=1 Tax=Mizuhopecten yessoensis TaxID=6573 RepID=A0A210QU66_MIZYE|nr:Neuronal acetylcholine receptor subunit alpha-9-I [Mizuhopecten yessoensis]